MGGDPVRLYFLQKKMPGSLSAASVVLDRTMQTLAVVLFLFVGLGAAWALLDLPPAWRFTFPLLTLLLAIGLWFLIHGQRKGIFDFISRILTKLGIRRHLTDSFQKNIEVLDERISRFYRHDHKRFIAVLGLHFLGRLLGVVEIFLIASLLSISLPLSGALFLASLSILVNMLFVFIPGSMGVMEGAYGALCALMGIPLISGVAIQLVRRVRTLFWISIGLVFMLLYSRSIRSPTTRLVEE